MSPQIEMISSSPPRYRYKRFNVGLVWAGKLLDFICFSYWKRSKTRGLSLNDVNSILVLESHLIGDGVMTLAFINTLKQVKPDLRIILAAQGWMRDLMGAGLVDEFVECHLPWVGSGKFSVQKWKNFYKSLKRIRQLEPSIAVETRGDWRNFFIFRILQVPRRLGTPISGGRVFLTHETSGQELMAPLWTSRIKLLEAFGVKKPLVLPPGPPPVKMQPLSDRFLIVHPGASQPLRQMDESQLKVVLSSVMNLSDLILVACGPNEKALQDKFIELIRKQGYRAEAWSGGLSDFFGLCQAAAAVFTMDSGPAHIAAWAGAKLTVFCNHDAAATVEPLTNNEATRSTGF